MTAESSALATTLRMKTESAVDVEELVRTYSALLFRVAHSILRSRQEAEDVVQDVFVRVLERRERLAEVQTMRVWLVRITWNLALDRRRRFRPDQMDEEFAATLAAKNLNPEEMFLEASRMSAVLWEIDHLPKAERKALLLTTVEDFEPAELASLLGKSESGLRGLIFRARKRLRERLEKGEQR